MQILIVGMSHINCMSRAIMPAEKCNGATFDFLQLKNDIFFQGEESKKTYRFDNVDRKRVAEEIQKRSKNISLTVLCPGGNEHTIVSLVKRDGNSDLPLMRRKIDLMMAGYRQWLVLLTENIVSPVVVLPPPPPIGSEKKILQHPGVFRELVKEHGVAPAAVRLEAWECQCRFIREICQEKGFTFFELPGETFSPDGFLGIEYLGNDPSHGNTFYGEILLKALVEYTKRIITVKRSMDKPADLPSSKSVRRHGRYHPYQDLPAHHFWKQAVAQVDAQDFDPVTEVPFKISPTDKVATAGSCFAKHISMRMKRSGFHFLVTESSSEEVDSRTGRRRVFDFSARYGNIYTVRQLLQLFERSFGYFQPIEGHWQFLDGRFVDPLRPQIEPEGFATIEALKADRTAHLQAVKEMFEQVDVFVFTMGLTECWVSRLDGTAYPLAPGVAGGEYNPEKYQFVNFEVDEIIDDFKKFVNKLRLVNPGARIILTVSPVPLVATYENRHVLVSTTYSKSVLRVAAETIARQLPGIYYFPSYEIITGNYNQGKYFGDDLRSIRQEGVNHVMAVFMKHMTGAEDGSSGSIDAAESDSLDLKMEELVEAACDEELLARE